MGKHQQEQLDDAIGLIYEAALDDSKWLAYMHCVAEVMDASHATFQLLDAHDVRKDIALTMGFDPVIEADWRTRRREEDFWLVGAQRNTGRIIIGTEAISARDMHAQPLYHEICRPLDVEHMMGFIVPLAKDQAVGWSFLRPPWLENFDGSHVRVMSALLPHLQRAARMRREFAALSQHAAALESVLNRSPTATLLLDGRGRVQFLNERALQLVRAGDGVAVVGNRIVSWEPQAQANLQAAIQSCLPQAEGAPEIAPIILRGRSSDRRLACHVFPVRPGARRPLADSQFACAVVVYEPRSEALSPAFLARAHHLSHAEAVVAARISEGFSPAQIAEMQGISINTVRTQLKSVFQKCGVRSQSQLVRLLAGWGNLSA